MTVRLHSFAEHRKLSLGSLEISAMAEGMNVDNNIAVLDGEWMYFDLIFLSTTNGYSMVPQEINRLERFTTSAMYRVISGILCT